MAAKNQVSSEAAVRPSILVVDDDVIIREILASVLNGEGFSVLLAATGREALSLATGIECSMAFLDLAMPHGNGMQTCALLRRLPGWHKVPIIILTGYSIETALRATMNAGASGFLCKPIVISELSWCLESHLGNPMFEPRASPIEDSYAPASISYQFDMPEETLPSAKSGWTLKYNSIPKIVIQRLADHADPDCSDNSITSIEQPAAFSHKQGDTRIGLGNPRTRSKLDLEDLSINVLKGLGDLLGPDIFDTLLRKLVISVDEVLGMLDGDRKLAESGDIMRRLHNLAGTAGTLGCGALSAAARELEADRANSDEIRRKFIKIADRSVSLIRLYTADRALASPGSSRVLIVDDVELNRELGSAFLRAAGYEVTCVEGGAEALMVAASTDFHVVLMDVRMPEMDGFEATRRIRKLPGSRGRVPIVGLTALASPDQIANCLRAGMVGHLAKPFDPASLVAAVLRAVEQPSLSVVRSLGL